MPTLSRTIQHSVTPTPESKSITSILIPCGAISDLQIGDKVDKVSATFGTDIWDAKNFGQIIYAIRTRNGKVYLKFKRMYGDMSALEDENMTEDERIWKREQAGGNVGYGTRQIQERNYLDKKQKEKERRELFEIGMKKFNEGNVDAALIDFENVIATESVKYMGDNFARVSDVGKAAQYNAACCYSMLGQIEAGMEALGTALKNGFEDYRKIRTDPNLEKLRDDDAFDDLIDQVQFGRSQCFYRGVQCLCSY